KRAAVMLAAGDHVELLEAGVARQLCHGEVDQLAADARVEDELAAIDVHRARPARSEDERLRLVEQHRLHLEQHPGGDFGDERLVGEVHGRADSSSPASYNRAWSEREKQGESRM